MSLVSRIAHLRFSTHRSKPKNADCVAKLLGIGRTAKPKRRRDRGAVIETLSKRKIRWQNQNPMILNPLFVNFKEFTVAPLIIRRLIISTIQPKSLSSVAATGRLNSSLAFTFVAVRVAANVLPNAENRLRAKDIISNCDHQLKL